MLLLAIEDGFNFTVGATYTDSELSYLITGIFAVFLFLLIAVIVADFFTGDK